MTPSPKQDRSDERPRKDRPTGRPREVTQMLLAWGDGDPHALDTLLPLTYEELRRLARRYLQRERPEHTLQPTALVHEAYLRLVDQKEVRWQNRAHFLGIAAEAMRRILVEHARAHRRAKRGGGPRRVSLEDTVGLSNERGLDLVALDDALASLAALDPRKSRVVELRFFGGLTTEETAQVLGVSTATVERELYVAKLWLRRALNPGGAA